MRLWMAPAGLHVEPANSVHIPPMVKLHGGNFFHGWTQGEFASYLTTPARTPVYVACNARNKVAGFMVLSLCGAEAELLTIVVGEKWRSKGVGNALLRAGFDDLLVSEVTAIFLEVDENNPRALALYTHFGFEKVGTRPRYYPLKDGSSATALVMRCNFN